MKIPKKIRPLIKKLVKAANDKSLMITVDSSTDRYETLRHEEYEGKIQTIRYEIVFSEQKKYD